MVDCAGDVLDNTSNILMPRLAFKPSRRSLVTELDTLTSVPGVEITMHMALSLGESEHLTKEAPSTWSVSYNSGRFNAF